ncbi:MAG: SDR family NAD(P)-dependent oxidoreductase [Christensenellales bacterium]|jgi:NAD(P)-dependent dehydrogenase (short-subunit alcohol dehydrogenase family)|nr:SDR family oxidoreductase [Christensenellaceae bacterium]
MRFENRVAIVTGGGMGLGKAYVKALGSEGCKVVIAEYSEPLGKACEQEMRELGYDVLFVKCDVSKEDEVKAMVEKTVETYGKIDILINNAQGADKSSLSTVTEDTTIEMFKINWYTGAFGTFLCTKYTIPYMKQQGYGRIINTASATGVNGMATFSALGSQKEAIRGLTRVCATELGSFGITCNVICPGALTEASRLWKEAYPELYEEAVAPQPIPRLGDPDTDIAPVVMFLASEDSRFVTGQTIGVDGGTTMMP